MPNGPGRVEESEASRGESLNVLFADSEDQEFPIDSSTLENMPSDCIKADRPPVRNFAQP